MVKAKKCFCGTLVYFLALLVLLSVVIFVIIPVIFKYSPAIQRNIIFPTWITEKENFSDIESYGIHGVRNFYVTVNEEENVTLGVWQILPNELLSDIVKNENYDYEGILADQNYNILIYLHGNGGVRAVPLELYTILRRHFHIFAPDYRSYGDSTPAELTENNIVDDIVSFYKWLRRKTQSRIFFWGHSLGTGVSIHAIANLKSEQTTPTGLILETPFSSVIDVMERDNILKYFKWLPWFRSTMLDPINDNGFGFESVKYIKDVDCPIMILHAKDDTVVPYELATKLYETALTTRDTTFQGNITYHLFEAKGYGHMYLYLAPELPTYTSNFIDECVDFEDQSNSTYYKVIN